jgi:hypothetical protein
MRSPVVKRQTLPRSGFFVFFPLFRAGDVSGSWRILTSFPCAGAEAVWLPQTLIEARSPIQRRVQRNGRCVLYGLETYRCPCTVLVKRGAARMACASSCQARVRGSTRRPGVTLAAYNGAGAGVQSTAVGFRGQGLGAPTRSPTQHNRPCRAHAGGSPRADPVRHQAHPLRSLRLEKLVQIERRVTG